jgi:hypothetical protein
MRRKDWALGRRFDIMDANDPTQLYLRRWRLIQTPWFALYLHKVLLPDDDRHMHDHPYNFSSLVLRGGYKEVVDYGDGWSWGRSHKAGSIHHMKAEWLHKIVSLKRVPTWTLLFVGRRRRTWGFWTENGWVAWHNYERETGNVVY